MYPGRHTIHTSTVHCTAAQERSIFASMSDTDTVAYLRGVGWGTGRYCPFWRDDETFFPLLFKTTRNLVIRFSVKIVKTVETRSQISRQKCTKFHFFLLELRPDPTGRAYNAPQTT